MANVVQVSSAKPANQVTAQNPQPGVVVLAGASVRINVSSGPKPVAVPSVIGLSYDSAAAQLQSAGFTVGRADVDSDQPAGQVVDQSPPGNSTASKGSPVTLSVSKGPTTVDGPDVRSDRDRRARDAQGGRLQGHRRQAGDGRPVARRARDVPGAGGNAQADPKSVVTLTVGTYVPPPDVTPPPPAADTGTTTDTTTTTDSTTTQTNP